MGTNDWGEDDVRELMRGIPTEVLGAAWHFFKALSVAPHEVDSITLADWTGMSNRELSGRLLRPIQMQAGRVKPGCDLPWSSWRAAPTAHLVARTMWRAEPELGRLLFEIFEDESKKGGVDVAATGETPQDRRHEIPAPSAVFIYRPEYAAGLDEEMDGWSSCLRESRPGSRAVVYRALSDQKLVAIFDVRTEPEWDDKFGWMAQGRSRR